MERRVSPRRKASPGQAGFSLIALSVLLLVASVLMASLLSGGGAGDVNQKAMSTVQKLQKVEQAVTGFMASNGRRPCPADGQYGVNSANFGKEAATPGTCTGGTPAAPLGPDAGTGYVVGGTIPTKALALDDSYAFDEWGRRITYVVDKRATLKKSCLTLQNFPTNNGTGGIQIESATGGTVLDNVMAAYISHGPDGHGAFPAEGSAVTGRLNTGTIDADKLTNAGVDAGFTYSTANFTNVKVKKDRTATFGDLTYYANYQKNLCCLGGAIICNNGFGIRIDGTEAGMNLQMLGTLDFNGDGIPDLVLMGMDQANNSQNIYVVFGQTSSSGFTDPLPVSSLNGTNGVEIVIPGGYVAPNGAGRWTQIVPGDFNGDGIQDMVINFVCCNGLYAADWVVFGQSGGWPASISTGALTTSSNPKGFMLESAFAPSYVAAGDVNGATNGGHNIDDIVFGQADSTAGPGYAYVFLGNANIANIPQVANSGGNMPTLDGTNGVTISGWGNGDLFGTTIALADLNHDGKKDIVIGANDSQGTWSGGGWWGDEVAVIWGQSSFASTGGAINASALPANGSQGFLFTEPSAGLNGWIPNAFRYPYLIAGDVNGDGIDDIQMGFISNNREAQWGGGIGQGPGIVVTVFGNGGWPASNSFDITTVNGTNGTVLAASPNWCTETPVGDGVEGYATLHGSIADISGDGKNSLYSYGQRCGSGTNYYSVEFGPTSGSWASPLLNDPTTGLNGTNGFTFGALPDVNPAGNGSLNPLTGGDVSGDGKPDLAIGDYNSNGNGAVYLIKGGIANYGNGAVTPASIGTYGWEFDGASSGDEAGWAVYTGDFNHDGTADLAISAPGASPGGTSGAGSVYVIWGSTGGWISPFSLGQIQ